MQYMSRMRDHVDPILRKYQAGFRSGRNCAQQIHILRRMNLPTSSYHPFCWLHKGIRFNQKECHVLSSVSLWNPEVIVNAISVLYSNSKSAVMVDMEISLTQSKLLSVYYREMFWYHFLFIILIDYLLRKATENTDSDVVTHPRQSKRHPAKILNDLDFEDDIALLESSIPYAQARLTGAAAAAEHLGSHRQYPQDREQDHYLQSLTTTASLWTANKTFIQLQMPWIYDGLWCQWPDQTVGSRMSCFFESWKKIGRSSPISISTKIELFNTTCVTMLVYRCE